MNWVVVGVRKQVKVMMVGKERFLGAESLLGRSDWA